MKPSDTPVRRPAARRFAWPRGPWQVALTIIAVVCLGDVGASAQYVPDEGPLLPDAVSSSDVTMRGRYARQWKQGDGTWVLVFNGGFRLDFGLRRLSATDAVVWIAPHAGGPDQARFYELTVYLSGNAQVREAAGTITEDDRLLVSHLRTSGQIIKYHDAHSPEVMETSRFYQRALADRKRIEGELAPPTEPEGAPVAVKSPAEQGPPKPPRVLTYEFGNVEPAETPSGEPVQVVTEGVYFAQTGGPKTPALEIRADNAVVFTSGTSGTALLGEAGLGEDTADAQPEAAAGSPGQKSPGGALGELKRVKETIRAVYLEGDVVLTLDNRFVRASRLYYDFEQDRAVILDGVLRADLPGRNVPLYVRADEIRQLSAREFAARNARVSTSEFYTPHYHVGAEQVYIEDRSQLDSHGRPSGEVAGTYEMRNATLNVEGLPVLWWPYSKGDYNASETLIRSFRVGHDEDFGTQVESRWYLFDLLGLETPKGYDATLRADYFTERGPAVGVDMDYHRPTYFGKWRGYYIHDEGEDRLGPLRDDTPDTDNRGRILWRHHHYLPEDWEATLEVSYISDPTFLEEYEKSEWFEGKDQETVLYLKRAKEVDAITLLANWRLLDFVTQTEHLPEVTYRRLGDTFASPLVLYHESRAGWVRYRPDDRRLFDERRFNNDGLTDATFRVDARQEAELPIKLPGVSLVPFATLRGSVWENQPLDRGSLWRGFGLYGLRGSSYLARVFDDVESELFDIHRIRHIVQPYFTAWWAHSNALSEIIAPFDQGIETIDDFYGVRVGVRQTWQTKRGLPGKRRTADLLRLNLEAGFFGGNPLTDRANGYVNSIRPEDSRPRNYAAGDLVYRLSDTTSFLYDFNIDLNDGTFDRHDFSIAIERLPRLAYVFGWRFAHEIDSNLIGGGYNYRLTEKHLTAMRFWYDLDSGRLGEITFSYVRQLPRWYVGVTVKVDRVFDDVSIGLSMWPEGIPEWTIGPRKFTGLAESAAIRP